MNRVVRLVIAGALVLVGLVTSRMASRAPTSHAAVDTSAAFIAEAREGTRRYVSQQEAINDGFVRVGVEFPAMGEHWVSFARIMEDSFVASRPSVLIYANTREGSRLAGVAYSRLLTGRGTIPAFPSIGAWHEHSGPVNQESLPLGHVAHETPLRTGTASADAPRLYILHAWAWQPNPAGPFATDNWSLPLVRLGLEDRDSLPPDALRAMSLATDEHEYYRLVVKTTLDLSDAEDSIVASVLERFRAMAAQELTGLRGAGSVTPPASVALGAVWDGLWLEMERRLPGRVPAIRRVRSQLRIPTRASP